MEQLGWHFSAAEVSQSIFVKDPLSHSIPSGTLFHYTYYRLFEMPKQKELVLERSRKDGVVVGERMDTFVVALVLDLSLEKP